MSRGRRPGRVGRRPVGNIRGLRTGGYRLRFRRDGQMRTAPETYPTRADAERALWRLAEDGRADYRQDLRYHGLVLLATFASLRWARRPHCGGATSICARGHRPGTLFKSL